MATVLFAAGCSEADTPESFGADAGRDGGFSDGGGSLDGAVRRSNGNVAPGDIITCHEAANLVSTRLMSDPALLAFRACDRDDECGGLPTDFSCPAQFTTRPRFIHCGTSIATRNVDAGLAWLATTALEICPRIELTPSGCVSVSDCTTLIPRCIEHVCGWQGSNFAPDAGVR